MYSHPNLSTLTLPYQDPDFGIRDLPHMRIQPSVRFYHSYNAILCPIFSSVTPAVGDGGFLQGSQRGPLTLTMCFTLLITRSKLVIGTLHESLLLCNTNPVPRSLYSFHYTSQIQEILPRQHILFHFFQSLFTSGENCTVTITHQYFICHP